MNGPTAATLARIESIRILAKKYSDAEIADRLGVSLRTVKRYAQLADQQHPARPRRPAPTGRWEQYAACRGAPDQFFLVAYQATRPEVKAAKQICRACPVIAQCRAFALNNPWWTSDGIWGGLTPAERERARYTARNERTAA